MSVDISQLMEIKSRINKARQTIHKLNEDLNKQQAELENICTHPTVITERSYCRGGYDYLSSVTISKTCTICDKVIECYNDPEHSGSYG